MFCCCSIECLEFSRFGLGLLGLKGLLSLLWFIRGCWCVYFSMLAVGTFIILKEMNLIIQVRLWFLLECLQSFTHIYFAIWFRIPCRVHWIVLECTFLLHIGFIQNLCLVSLFISLLFLIFVILI